MSTRGCSIGAPGPVLVGPLLGAVPGTADWTYGPMSEGWGGFIPPWVRQALSFYTPGGYNRRVQGCTVRSVSPAFSPPASSGSVTSSLSNGLHSVGAAIGAGWMRVVVKPLDRFGDWQDDHPWVGLIPAVASLAETGNEGAVQEKVQAIEEALPTEETINAKIATLNAEAEELYPKLL
jgi:hypothetical protein